MTKVKNIFIPLILLFCLPICSEQQDTRRLCAAKTSNPIVECSAVEKKLEQLNIDFDVCCQNLQGSCSTVNQQIQELTLSATCDQSICINQSLIDTATPQIQQSGVYYLTENVDTSTHALVIDADNVVLDLNGFVMSGGLSAIQATSHTNIQIVNGKIDATTSTGMLLTSCTTVQIADISFSTISGQSAQLNSVNGFNLKDCSVVNSSSGGSSLGHYEFTLCNNGVISGCSVADSSSGRGFLFTDCSNVYCSQLQVLRMRNPAEGYSVGGDSSNVNFDHCFFNENSSTRNMTGFNISCVGSLVNDCYALENDSARNSRAFMSSSSAVNVIFDSCYAIGNTKPSGGSQTLRGFQILGNYIFVRNCLAMRNLSVSPGSGVGYQVSASNSCFFNNKAALNTTYGFDNSGTNNVFLGNVAYSNPINYNGTIGPNQTFDLSDGILTGTPVVWNNINSQP